MAEERHGRGMLCVNRPYVARATTGKLYHVTFLSNSTFPLCVYIWCCQANLKALSYVFCEGVNRPVGPTRSVLVIQLTSKDAKTTVLCERPQNNHCAPSFPVHTRCVVCGTFTNPDLKENE